jgi:hypothetical protein
LASMTRRQISLKEKLTSAPKTFSSGEEQHWKHIKAKEFSHLE